jgi:hypothetical protein
VIETAGHGYSFKIVVETGNWASTHRCMGNEIDKKCCDGKCDQIGPNPLQPLLIHNYVGLPVPKKLS